jgi:hypothetical protein
VESPLEVTLLLFKRYKKLAFEYPGIADMCSKALDNPQWPIDKLSRWLGYVQTEVIRLGLTTITIERDYSRPLFHEAYSNTGIEIPETVNINQ